MAKFMLELKTNEGESVDFAEISLMQGQAFQCEITASGEIVNKKYTIKKVS